MFIEAFSTKKVTDEEGNQKYKNNRNKNATEQKEDDWLKTERKTMIKIIKREKGRE